MDKRGKRRTVETLTAILQMLLQVEVVVPHGQVAGEWARLRRLLVLPQLNILLGHPLPHLRLRVELPLQLGAPTFLLLEQRELALPRHQLLREQVAVLGLCPRQRPLQLGKLDGYLRGDRRRVGAGLGALVRARVAGALVRVAVRTQGVIQEGYVLLVVNSVLIKLDMLLLLLLVLLLLLLPRRLDMVDYQIVVE